MLLLRLRELAHDHGQSAAIDLERGARGIANAPTVRADLDDFREGFGAP